MQITKERRIRTGSRWEEFPIKKELRKKFSQTWNNLISRCTNPKDKRYSYYSKVGVSNEWKDFKNFQIDMLETFLIHVDRHGIKNTTIERLNNKEGYNVNNCRWATWKEQRENKTLFSLSSEEKLVPFFVRITREQRRLVRQAAREEKVSEAEVVRRLITNILK